MSAAGGQSNRAPRGCGPGACSGRTRADADAAFDLEEERVAPLAEGLVHGAETLVEPGIALVDRIALGLGPGRQIVRHGQPHAMHFARWRVFASAQGAVGHPVAPLTDEDGPGGQRLAIPGFAGAALQGETKEIPVHQVAADRVADIPIPGRARLRRGAEEAMGHAVANDEPGVANGEAGQAKHAARSTPTVPPPGPHLSVAPLHR